MESHKTVKNQSITRFINSCEPLRNKVLKFRARLAMQNWLPYSRLFLKGDNAPWVLTNEMKSLGEVCKHLHIHRANLKWLPYIDNQSVFYASRHELLGSQPWKHQRHRFATAFYHGRPGSEESIFDELYKTLCESHMYLHRVQVSHTEMHDIVLTSGIDPHKVFLIPIGVDILSFHMQTSKSKKTARKKFGIPESAVVVGSFQKDGSGWGEGNEPKLIKGPDIFLAVTKILRQKVPDLFVLLTGPSRGYVKRGLLKLNVPFKHIQFNNYHDLNNAYQALDLYIVTSRQEGGPKTILESMATGIPLVTTRVGQAMDLVKHGENAWMTTVEDVDGLAYWSLFSLEQSVLDKQRMIQSARRTAEENSYIAQIPLWKRFMDGFVETR